MLPARPATIMALAPERYKIQFTASVDTHDKLAAAKRPRKSSMSDSGSRHVPAAVKREVWARDQGRCAFVGTKGRCAERGFLEFHHLVPFADGGPTVTDNLELRCRPHNQFEAERWSGPMLVREARHADALGTGRPPQNMPECL